MTPVTTPQAKAETFRALHEGPGAFIIPNPWDVGSARLMAGMGFKALATTSSGFAYSMGRRDGEVTLEEALAHCRVIAASTHIPVSADLENLFADDPDAVAHNLRQAAATGIVGGSIEDYSSDSSRAIYPFSLAVERVQAAVEAIANLDFSFTLTARAENLLRGVKDMDDTIRRLQAFEAAGADVLYAPGLRTLEEVKLVSSAVNKPVNVLAVQVSGVSQQQLAEAGARRLSIGGALARVVMGTTIDIGRAMLAQGTFEWISGMASDRDIDQLFGQP